MGTKMFDLHSYSIKSLYFANIPPKSNQNAK
jgi:hypothetical protein